MTTAPAPPRIYSADEFFTMPNGELYELLDGELVERSMGHESSWIAVIISAALTHFSLPRRLGFVSDSSLGLRIFPGRPGRIPRPDVSYIRRERLPGGRPSAGFLEDAPDLVVEVVSPGDAAMMLEVKVTEYRQVGIPLIWVVYSESRQVHVIRENGPEVTLGMDDMLTGEPALPGFTMRVADVFPE